MAKKKITTKAPLPVKSEPPKSPPDETDDTDDIDTVGKIIAIVLIVICIAWLAVITPAIINTLWPKV